MSENKAWSSAWMAGAFLLAFSGLALADSSASLGLFASAQGGSNAHGGLFDGVFAFFADVGASIQSAFSGGASASNESGRSSFGFGMASDAFVADDVYASASQGSAASEGRAGGVFGDLFASGAASGAAAAGGSAASDARAWAWGSSAATSGAAAVSGGMAGGYPAMNRSSGFGATGAGAASGVLGLGLG